jgi:hypothetical protein
MEENRDSLSKGLLILIIIGIVCVGFLAYLGIKDVIEQKKWAEQWKIESSTTVDRLDDSTYHINLGDGSSCFTMEKINDSLSLSGVNIYMMSVDKDTITVIAKQNSGSHIYEFAYKDFYEGNTPFNRKIGFNMN